MRLTRMLLPVFTVALATVLNGCQVDSPGSQETPEVPTAPGIDGGNDTPDDPDAPEEFTETATGLKHRILRKGSDRKPAKTDTVVCHYKGWLDDGTVFDSSYKRGEPTEFPLNGVIEGWTEGLQLIGEGGKVELEIPYQLGYKERGMPPDIPPKARLHFTVELIKVK